MSKDIQFVVVTYRPKREKFTRLLQSLAGWKVQVVDNTDNNAGYAGGANEGIRKVLAEGADWFVVMNDDMKIVRKALNNFSSKLLQTPSGIAGPFRGALDSRRWTTLYPSDTADYLSGSFIAIHRDVLDKVGVFFDPYFIYYEEVDLCIRAKRAGFLLSHIPTFGITHRGSLAFGRDSFLHQYYHSRNHLLFVERQGPVGVKLYEFFRLPLTIWEHIVRREWGALLGIRDYFLRRFGQYNSGQ